jgi:hypothetical protein
MEREAWKEIERGEDRCAACGRGFEAREACFSALFAAGDSFRRRDYCAACFGALAEKPASFWKRSARRGAKEASPEKGAAKRAQRRRDLDALLELFERLSAPEGAAPEPQAAGGPATAGDPSSHGPSSHGAAHQRGIAEDERAKLRYLLALALVRKRRLELVELAREGGADCLVLRASGDAELRTVAAPRLSEEDLARLSRELEQEVGLS